MRNTYMRDDSILYTMLITDMNERYQRAHISSPSLLYATKLLLLRPYFFFWKKDQVGTIGTLRVHKWCTKF